MMRVVKNGTDLANLKSAQRPGNEKQSLPRKLLRRAEEAVPGGTELETVKKTDVLLLQETSEIVDLVIETSETVDPVIAISVIVVLAIVISETVDPVIAISETVDPVIATLIADLATLTVDRVIVISETAEDLVTETSPTVARHGKTAVMEVDGGTVVHHESPPGAGTIAALVTMTEVVEEVPGGVVTGSRWVTMETAGVAEAAVVVCVDVMTVTEAVVVVGGEIAVKTGDLLPVMRNEVAGDGETAGRPEKTGDPAGMIDHHQEMKGELGEEVCKLL